MPCQSKKYFDYITHHGNKDIASTHTEVTDKHTESVKSCTIFQGVWAVSQYAKKPWGQAKDQLI